MLMNLKQSLFESLLCSVFQDLKLKKKIRDDKRNVAIKKIASAKRSFKN